MTNNFPGLAKITIPLSDVREVALAHINALGNSNSDGKRYILTENSYWFDDVANILNTEFS